MQQHRVNETFQSNLSVEMLAELPRSHITSGWDWQHTAACPGQGVRPLVRYPFVLSGNSVRQLDDVVIAVDHLCIECGDEIFDGEEQSIPVEPGAKEG